MCRTWNLRPPGPLQPTSSVEHTLDPKLDPRIPPQRSLSAADRMRAYGGSIGTTAGSRLQVESPWRDDLQEGRWRRVGERQDLAGELKHSTPLDIATHGLPSRHEGKRTAAAPSS